MIYIKIKAAFDNIPIYMFKVLSVSILVIVKLNNFIIGSTANASAVIIIIKAIKAIYMDFCQLRFPNTTLNKIILKMINKMVCVPKGILKKLYMPLEKTTPIPYIAVNKACCLMVGL
jgi:hypothetical protein